MRIQLSEHFDYKKLLRFVLPSVVMIVFTLIYGVVDGLFISNFVGKSALTAINLIMPLLIIMGAIGFMIGTGGSALVAKTLGEKEPEKAHAYFSMLVICMVAAGLLLTVLGQLLLPKIASLLGAAGATYDYCVLYGRIVLSSMIFFMLQNVFQSFFVVAEKPRLGLIVTVAAGAMNIVLDALFVAGFRWGLAGAAIATAVSQIFGGVFPVLYFMRRNDSLLRFAKPIWDMKILLKSCANGSSEFLSNISASVVTLLYNFQLMKIAGEDGVAAYGAIMYVSMIFLAFFMGYAVGCSPVISYHYGAKNHDELKNLFRKSLVIMGVLGVGMTALAEGLAVPLSKMFVGYDEALFVMTLRGYRIYAFSFLICGFNVFGSALFTALNNGWVSAVISFIRTLVLPAAAILALPVFFALDGVCMAINVSEGLALLVTFAFMWGKRKKYRYA